MGNSARLVTWDSSKTEGKMLVRISSDLGCSASKEFKIIYGKPANAAFITDNTICQYDTNWYVPKDTSLDNYQWFFGDGTNSTAKYPKHRYVSTGEFQTKLVVQNTTGCRDTFISAVIVKEYSRKPGSIKGDKNVVANTIETYLVDSRSYGAFSWRVTGGEILSGNLSNIISVQWGDSVANAEVKVVWLEDGLCPSDTTFLPVRISVSQIGIAENNYLQNFKIYPNPFNTEIIIESKTNFSNSRIIKRICLENSILQLITIFLIKANPRLKFILKICSRAYILFRFLMERIISGRK